MEQNLDNVEREIISELKMKQLLTEENYKLDSDGRLIELHLSEMDLKDLPESICELKYIEVLDVSDNALKELPESFGKLSSLEALNLSGNPDITFLPESFRQLTRLKELTIGGMDLDPLYPEMLRELTKLENLNLSPNDGMSYNPEEEPIYELPEWLGELINLETLVIGHNSLYNLPVSMINLTKLRYLDLIPSNRLLNLVSNSYEIIQSLYLQGCRIEAIGLNGYPPVGLILRLWITKR